MLDGAFDEGGAYDCAKCDAGRRFILRCAKLTGDEGDDAWVALERAKTGRRADARHPEACVRHWLEESEAMDWLKDAALYEHGALLVTGGIEDQPARWLEAQRIIASAKSAHLKREAKK